jgi:hypothetical protein
VGNAQWRKSSFSNPSGNCVELAPFSGDVVGIRDSNDPDVVVRVSRADLAAFFAGVRHREFDDLAEASGR